MARSGRYLARRCAVQALYQWKVTGQATSEIESSFIKNESLGGRHLEYFLHLIKNIPGQATNLDEILSPHLDRTLEKVDLVEHAILWLGTYIPVNVVIDEAIDLAKTFSSEHGYKYVNGVLDKVAQEVRNSSPSPA